MPDLVVLLGPPASGKAAIGTALAQLTGYRLFHNHMTADAVAALFGWATGDYREIAAEVRLLLLQRAVARQVEGGIIFTFMWAFDLDDDNAFIDDLVALFELHGNKVSFVELLASREARVKREGSPLRVALKPAKRDVRGAKALHGELDAKHRFNSEGAFPYPDRHMLIDTEMRNPKKAARIIAEHFDLPRVGS